MGQTWTPDLRIVFFLLVAFLSEPVAGVFLTPASAQTPIQIQNLQKLNFGQVVSESLLTGSVTIDPITGNKTMEGGVQSMGGTVTRAAFEITGDPNKAFLITLPTEVQIRAKTATGTQLIRLSDFIAWTSPAGINSTGPDGKAQLYVGAQASLGAGQTGATYNTTFEVFVDYAVP